MWVRLLMRLLSDFYRSYLSICLYAIYLLVHFLTGKSYIMQGGTYPLFFEYQYRNRSLISKGTKFTGLHLCCYQEVACVFSI
jgi:hypothetical protein